MATKIGVNEFRERILRESGGISSSNLYEFQVGVGATSYLSEFFKNNMNFALTDGVFKLNLLCNEIQIPGVTYSAFDLKSPHKGITQKMAMSKVYNEMDISFYCDADSIPIKFFRAWQDMVMGNYDNPKAMYSPTSAAYTQIHQAYSQAYYDEYTYDIIVNKLEKYGTKPKESYTSDMGFRLASAYPYTVSSVPYSAGPAQLVKVTVGMYYEYSSMYFK